jgi:hypothetical protein
MMPTEKKTSPFLVAAAWVVVLIPLGWGVVQSVDKSRPLFRPPAASKALPARRPGAVAPILRQNTRDRTRPRGHANRGGDA